MYFLLPRLKKEMASSSSYSGPSYSTYNENNRMALSRARTTAPEAQQPPNETTFKSSEARFLFWIHTKLHTLMKICHLNMPNHFQSFVEIRSVVFALTCLKIKRTHKYPNWQGRKVTSLAEAI